MASTPNFQSLKRAVIDASVADRWSAAVLEWEVTYVEERPQRDGECVCGQTGLLWLYTIANDSTGTELFPIGSSCVNHFGRSDLTKQISIFRKLVFTRDAARAGERVEITSTYFSRAVLDYLLLSGAFTPDAHNGNDGAKDHAFLRQMFGKKDKSALSTKQAYRLRKLLDDKVIPFLLTDPRLG